MTFGTAVILSGPSGVGKSTLIGRVRRELPELEFSVSCTTRTPRPGEIDHVHYHFLSEEEFSLRQERGEFIEHAGVFARRYGTLRSEVMDRVSAGRDVVLDIDVQGAMQIREAARKDPQLAAVAEFVFVAPPSMEELERRLRGRGTESEEQIRLRLGLARRELSFWRRYDYLLINHDVEYTAVEMAGLIRAFRLKSSRQPEELFS